MLEPLVEHEARLQEICRTHDDLHYELAAAGETAGHSLINVSADLDGSGFYGEKGAGERRAVPVTTVDDAVARHGLAGPYALKLDTHGFELAILAGASQVLRDCVLLVIEVYAFHVSPTGVLFWELCDEVDRLGFRVADVAGLMGRQGDGLFWQADFLYLQKGHPAFERASYAVPSARAQ
jgi:FkbM family methyltransferase